MYAHDLAAILRQQSNLEVARKDFAHGICQTQNCSLRYRLSETSDLWRMARDPNDVDENTPGAIPYLFIE